MAEGPCRHDGDVMEIRATLAKQIYVVVGFGGAWKRGNTLAWGEFGGRCGSDRSKMQSTLVRGGESPIAIHFVWGITTEVRAFDWGVL